MKKFILKAMMLTLIFAFSCNSTANEDDFSVGIQGVRVKVRAAHNGCADPRGVCVVIIFVQGDPVGSDEVLGYASASGTSIVFTMDNPIWETNGDVPITSNVNLSSDVTTALGIPSGSYLLSNTYSANIGQSTVAVNYTY